MKEYEIANDNELLSLAEESNEEAAVLLINKHSNIINICISKYNKYLETIGLEEKDLYQEGLLGLLEAINRFDKDRNVQFNTYATRCINSRIKSYLKMASRNKHSYLNKSLSLDDVYENELYNNLSKNKEITPEEKVLLKEQLNEINKKVKEKLTKNELKVFELKNKGYKNEEISLYLSKDKRSIENTIHRINKKLKEIKKDVI